MLPVKVRQERARPAILYHMVGAQESSRERRLESDRNPSWMKLLCLETELHMANAGDRDEPEPIRGPMNEILRREIPAAYDVEVEIEKVRVL